MRCTINDDLFYTFTKNTWISDTDTSIHITNNDISMCHIHESEQGSLGHMKAMKKGKIQQIDGSGMTNILWPLKYCTRKKHEPILSYFQTLAR